MDPITVLLNISGSSIVLLFCLYSALALYWYLTEDDATTYQHTLGATDMNRTEDTVSQRTPEDTSTASQRTPWAADTNTNRTKNDSTSTERHRRRQRRR